MVPLDAFSNVLIVTTYIFFVIRYLKIKRSFSVDLHLKNLLIGILETLKTYRRMFYLVLIILLINIVVSFVTGYYLGIKYNASKLPGGIESFSTSKIFMIIGVGLAFLIPLVAGTFFLLRWGFNKLYGRYLVKLNETLTELDESDNELV
jgi:Ni,Fe-hydrogenase I cytochrome b subunit